ncbi:MAG TPA: hypothetical protein ACQGQH_03045 [Xylella sp.]
MLGYFQAFLSLWWQHWDPRPRDEWPLHWVAVFGSALINLGFLFLLIWSLAIRWVLPPPSGGDGRVSVSLIGHDVPASSMEVGPSHDAVPAVAASSMSRAAPSAIHPLSAPSVGVESTPPVHVPDGNTRLPSFMDHVPSKVEIEQRVHPAIQQPLQVTEVPVPTTDFVVSPLQHASEMPISIRERSLPQVPPREVQIVDDLPRPLQMSSHDPQVSPPHVIIPSVGERDVVMPDQPQFSMKHPQPVVPALRPQEPREVSDTAAVASVPVQAPSEEHGQRGKVVVSHDKGGDASRRSDDWGLVDRQRPGEGGQGFFDKRGGIRVPKTDTLGGNSRASPGSESDTWTRERIAQSGQWLKRPPYDYVPTVFEQYWVPSESLLQEWVSRGIKKIEIPIPGTHTKIQCVVSLLQFGGGCGLTNSNMNDQPAIARPPPDIPFKKELQDDNGSVR